MREKWGRYWGFSDFGQHPIDLDWVSVETSNSNSAGI